MLMSEWKLRILKEEQTSFENPSSRTIPATKSSSSRRGRSYKAGISRRDVIRGSVVGYAERVVEGRGGGGIKLAFTLLLSEDAGGEDSGIEELLLELLLMAGVSFPDILKWRSKGFAGMALEVGSELGATDGLSCKRAAGDEGGREELSKMRDELGTVGGFIGEEESVYSDVDAGRGGGAISVRCGTTSAFEEPLVEGCWILMFCIVRPSVVKLGVGAKLGAMMFLRGTGGGLALQGQTLQIESMNWEAAVEDIKVI